MAYMSKYPPMICLAVNLLLLVVVVFNFIAFYTKHDAEIQKEQTYSLKITFLISIALKASFLYEKFVAKKNPRK